LLSVRFDRNDADGVGHFDLFSGLGYGVYVLTNKQRPALQYFDVGLAVVSDIHYFDNLIFEVSLLEAGKGAIMNCSVAKGFSLVFERPDVGCI